MTEVINERVQAETLATALRQEGCVVMVLKKGSHQQHPCLLVATNRPAHYRLTEHVYLAPEDGQWWFWWGDPLDRICPIDQVDVAVMEILASLGPRRLRGGQRPSGLFARLQQGLEATPS